MRRCRESGRAVGIRLSRRESHISAIKMMKSVGVLTKTQGGG